MPPPSVLVLLILTSHIGQYCFLNTALIAEKQRHEKINFYNKKNVKMQCVKIWINMVVCIMTDPYPSNLNMKMYM